MTIDQAKFILQAYRPDQDTSDHPDLEEAVKMLEENQDLQEWFEEERAFDNTFAAKLATIDVPADLNAQILSQVVQTSDNVVEFPWWKQFSMWGAAASMLLVLGLVLLPTTRQDPFLNTEMTIQTFQSFANHTLKNATGFNARAADWDELVKYLSDHDTPAPASLPGKINEMPSVGCMTVKFGDKPVGVICFGKNGKSHIFVINSNDFPRMPEESRPILDQNPYATTAYWSENNHHYLLVSHDPQELSQFVSF